MNKEEIKGIQGAYLFTPRVHDDGRGYFLEIFRESFLGEKFVQANHSHSSAGVLRGLHYHRYQTDAWYLVAGIAQAMLVDVRERAEKPIVVPIALKSSEPAVLVIPPGVAHGFYAVTDVDLIYWVTNYYDATDEHGIAWDDATISAPWLTDSPLLSDRDLKNPRLTWEEIRL